MAEIEKKDNEEKIEDGTGGAELGGLDEDMDDTLILVSSDENPKKFEINKKAALMCNLVKSILEGDAQAKTIEIKKVQENILTLIVEYLKHHNGKKPAEIAKPIRSVKMERIVEDKWDADFINNMSKKMIFQVILGANYMDLPSLLSPVLVSESSLNICLISSGDLPFINVAIFAHPKCNKDGKSI